MQIADDRVVLIHYTLTNDAGKTLDSSAREPLAYLHGRGICSGHESKLIGRVAGDKLDVRSRRRRLRSRRSGPPGTSRAARSRTTPICAWACVSDPDGSRPAVVVVTHSDESVA